MQTATKIFKEWVLKTYKTPWHILCNTMLWEAVDQYKGETNISIPKFWD